MLKLKEIKQNAQPDLFVNTFMKLEDIGAMDSYLELDCDEIVEKFNIETIN